MEVFARSPQELEEIWKYLQIDVARLVADFNSTNVLIEMEKSQIASTGDIVENDVAHSSAAVRMEWKPAGNWNGSEITAPDLTKPGWLPIDTFQNSFGSAEDMVPDNAVWYYNVAADEEFKVVFDRVITPYNQNLLDVDGVFLLYGGQGAYQVTKDTVFWMSNINYQIEMVSKNPWPDDYIDGVELAKERIMRLTVPFAS